ncbi:MAG: hypothetical protein Q9166_007063 [cf. Caloplaca sp. 2 TL-2023]
MGAITSDQIFGMDGLYLFRQSQFLLFHGGGVFVLFDLEVRPDFTTSLRHRVWLVASKMPNLDCDWKRMAILGRRGEDAEMLRQPASLYTNPAIDFEKIYESLLDHSLIDGNTDFKVVEAFFPQLIRNPEAVKNLQRSRL